MLRRKKKKNTYTTLHLTENEGKWLRAFVGMSLSQVGGTDRLRKLPIYTDAEVNDIESLLAKLDEWKGK